MGVVMPFAIHFWTGVCLLYFVPNWTQMFFVVMSRITALKLCMFLIYMLN